MKPVLIFLIVLIVTVNVQAEDSRPWWRSSAATDIATTAADSTASHFFSDSEKNVLGQYLKDYREFRQEDDDDERHEKKNSKNKNDKHKDKSKGKHKDKKKRLPPGLQKKAERGGQLPPGWQKKIARGEVLDAEMYEASSDLPKGILDQLPDAPGGTSVRQIEDTVVRVMDTTGEILDVLTGSGN